MGWDPGGVDLGHAGGQPRVAVRVVENETQRTWASVHEDLQGLHVVIAAGDAGTFAQTTPLTRTTKTVFAALHLAPPRTVLHATPAPAGAAGAGDRASAEDPRVA